jgi:hypothetical protein
LAGNELLDLVELAAQSLKLLKDLFFLELAIL